MGMRRSMAAAGLALLVAAGASGQQPLVLEEALSRAERQAYGNRIAAGQADAAAAQRTAALRGILPTVRLESGFMRTTDPIGAFGTTLRQRQITQADFDPSRLNFPGETDNWMGAVVVEQPLLNADAHLGRAAASRAGDAAAAQAAWARSGTRLEVFRAYWGAVLAAEKVVTLEAAYRAAQKHVTQAEAMHREGLVTKSDALLASVKAGELEGQLVEAQGDAQLALRGLALLLGEPAASFAVPATLPGAETVRRLLAAELPAADLAARGDVRAASAGARAASLDLQRARSLHLPRLNAFARYDWNSSSAPYRGDENWSLGVMASWTLFGGASEWAEKQAAGGRAASARAGLEAAQAQASLDVERADNARRVALVRLDVAERGAAQSAEAHRIVSRRYEGGLATVIELLDAAAMETGSALALSHARYTGIMAEAEGRRARGQDPASVAGALTTGIAGMIR